VVVSNVSEVGFLLVTIELSVADHSEVLVTVHWIIPLDVVLYQRAVDEVDSTSLPVSS